MKTVAYEPFKVKCKKTVEYEGEKGNEIMFMEGEEYNSCWPEVWPDPTQMVCLIDHHDDEHFMDWKWFHEHFEKLV